MEEKNIKINLGAIQETLILPLWARARETEKENPLINDIYAKDIISRIDYDFSKLEAGQIEQHQLVWPLRAYNFDTCLQRFLENHEKSIVINIGAGLDTTFRRINNGSLIWINLDLPDVTALRHNLIPDSEREFTVSKSVFDFTWIENIYERIKKRTVLFMAAGVLCYFTENENKTLFHKLAEVFPEAHFIFDAMSWFTVKATNWAIMKQSGLDSSVRLKWHLNSTSQLRKWVDSIEVVEEYSMFSGIQPRKDWGRKIIRDFKIMKFLHMQNRYKMVHVKL